MSIYERPRGSETSSFVALQQPQKWNDEEVVCIAVAKLVPPIFSNDFVLGDLISAPQMAITILVQENGLKDVIFERNLGREPRT